MEQKEKEKYQKIWRFKEYSIYSNECNNLETIYKWAIKKPIKNITIVGCGEGYGLHYFAQKGYNVLGIDIVNVNRFSQYKFVESPIWQANIPYYLDYGYSDLIIAIDVLEHIPPEKLDNTLKNISNSCKFFYFSIFCKEDNMGKLINDNLHLSVLKPEEWLAKIREYFIIENYNGGNVNIIIKGRYKDGK